MKTYPVALSQLDYFSSQYRIGEPVTVHMRLEKKMGLVGGYSLQKPLKTIIKEKNDKGEGLRYDIHESKS